MCWREQAGDHLFLPKVKLFWKRKRVLQLVFMPHFLHDFLRKMFLLFCSVNWPSFIVGLTLFREMLGNMCILIVYSGCDIIKFEINLAFLTSPFLHMTEESKRKFKYLNNEKNFSDEIKNIFYNFWRTIIEANKKNLEGKSPTLVQNNIRRWNL